MTEEISTLDTIRQAVLEDASEEDRQTDAWKMANHLLHEIAFRDRLLDPTVPKILSSQGIFRANYNTGFQYYHVVGKDENNRTYILAFGIQLVYQQSLEKAFRRFFPVPAPLPGQNKDIILVEGDKGDGSGADNPPDTGAKIITGN